MKTIKKNVWKPFLFGCIGLFIATVVFASVRKPFDVPEPPGTPHATDWGTEYCKIEFTRPVDDGGSPITHYLVEGLDKHSGRWTLMGRYDGFGNDFVINCTITNLIEGREYQFRARAVNMAGKSDPSGASKPIIAKER